MGKRSNSKEWKRKRIRLSLRQKISGTSEMPRLSVFKSNTAVYCQLIDDVNGVTLTSANSREEGMNKGNRSEQADLVGASIAEKAKAINIESVVFDRGGYPYHGVVKALADGARKGGLKF